MRTTALLLAALTLPGCSMGLHLQGVSASMNVLRAESRASIGKDGITAAAIAEVRGVELLTAAPAALLLLLTERTGIEREQLEAMDAETLQAVIAMALIVDPIPTVTK